MNQTNAEEKARRINSDFHPPVRPVNSLAYVYKGKFKYCERIGRS